MIWNIVIYLAVTCMILPTLNCQEKNATPMTKTPVALMDKITTPQNKNTYIQKNNTFISQQNENVVKHGHLETNWKPKTRQVSTDVSVTSASQKLDDMNAEQSFHSSPLMMYPFPMMNRYYPRYFPYTYTNFPGYTGYPGYPGYPGYTSYPGYTGYNYPGYHGYHIFG